MVHAWLTLLCGALCLFASACVGTHEILMSPDRPNYPTARRRLRFLMFLWSGALMYRGVELTTSAWDALAGGPPVLPVTPGQVLATMVLAAVAAAALEHHMRQWLPAPLQARVRRWLDIASCGHARKLAEARASARAASAPILAPVPQLRPVRDVSAALAQLAMTPGVTLAGPGEGVVEALLDGRPPPKD